MTNEIPHERSYKCRKLELQLRQLDSELVHTQNWTQDDSVRWDLRAAGRYLLIPLIRINRYLTSLHTKVVDFNDRCDQRDYLRDIKE
ncbi:MAG: hypothetical protein WCT85_03450 [Parachlamydiales bacterium]|jgi:hypothetical protein